MVPLFLLLHPFFIENKAFKILRFMQIFYVLLSIAYTENLGLHHYVGFLQIWSHIIRTRIVAIN